jgi:signal transduction histidine kinase
MSGRAQASESDRRHGQGYGAATTRIFRTMVLAFGPAAIVFGALAAPTIIERFWLITPLWSVPTLMVTLAVPAAASVAAPWASVRSLRFMMGVTAVGYALAMLTFQLALRGGSIPDAGSPWILGLTAIGTTAAAIAWRPRYVWPYVALVSVLTAVDRVLAADVGIAATAGEDALYTLMFCSVFAALALISVRAGRTLDAAAAVSRAEAGRVAATRARAQEAARIDGLVHDSVLATLLVAARGEDAASQAGTAARRALAQLDALRATDSAADQSQQPMDAHEFVWHLQSITTDLDPDTQFDYDPIPQAQIPADVSQALGEAMGEALRNSIRHAGGAGINSTGTDGAGTGGAGIDGTGTGSTGTGSAAALARAGDPAAQVTRAVHVSVRAAATGTAAIDVTILDDGIGFDPSAVDGARLGIEVSIRGRMSSIPGGHAMVVSRVGDGTRVMLQWRQQAVSQRAVSRK